MSTMQFAQRSSRSFHNFFQRIKSVLSGIPISSLTFSGFLILAALLAFEFFNYGTTEFALNDLLGDLSFTGVRWSVVLALAFCGMDFAGIARLLAPGTHRQDRYELLYLFGAWILAASMNAILSWWAVSLALVNHQGLGNEVLPREELLQSVPVFVAGLVVLLRIMIIGTLTLGQGEVFARAGRQVSKAGAVTQRSERSSVPNSAPHHINPAPKPAAQRAPLRTPLAARAPRR